jgi:PST family polysaccharide transporter
MVTTALAIQLGLYGALIALAIYQSLSFFITLFLCHKASWFKINYLIGGVDKQAVKNLAKYTAMALTSAACVPMSHILIRNHLGETLGWEAAGYWEAMWRLSSAYLMLITTTLGVYYLPKLSEIQTPEEIRTEILQGFKIIMPVAVTFGITIYSLRHIIIKILFTEKFAQMETLFAWQLTGDTIKIGSWLFAYIMLGKGMVKLFILSEISFSFLFYFLSTFLTDKMAIEGVAAAHAINYLVYLLFMYTIFRKKIFLRKKNQY